MLGPWYVHRMHCTELLEMVCLHANDWQQRRLPSRGKYTKAYESRAGFGDLRVAGAKSGQSQPETGTGGRTREALRKQPRVCIWKRLRSPSNAV